MIVNTGDFVVVRSRWSMDCVQATKITKQMIFYIDTSWNRPREKRVSNQDALFAGPEAIAKKLLQQLRSSEQQKTQDQQAASERRRKRDGGFIAAAFLASGEAQTLSDDRSAVDQQSVVR